MFGRLLQPIAVRSGQHFHGHDQLLADRVDRRIGHLRKELLEVGIKQARLLGEHGQRGVVAHGTDGFLAGFAHGLEDRRRRGEFLLGVTGGELLLHERRAGRRLRFERWRADDVLDVLAEPPAIRLLLRVEILDLVVAQERALDRVDGDHFTGPEPAFFGHLGVVDGQQAHFGAERQEPILGDLVTGGAQTVAVEARADGAAVAEDERGGTVPRLVERLVILVKFLHVRRGRGIALPSRRDEHKHRVKNIAAAHDEEFERIVEAGRVAAARLDDGAQLLDVVTEEGAFQFRFAGLGPEPVAHDGVDLAVVAEHPARLRKRPGREGVRAVALMENGQRCRVIRIAQVEIETFQRGRGQQALVDDGTAGEARDVEILDPLALGLVLDLVAAKEELPLELVVAHLGGVGPADQDLLDVGTGAQGLFAQDLAIHGHRAPTEDEELVLVQGGLGDVAAAGLGIRIVRQEHHADA